MLTFTKFKVAGETAFPFDMLRWDGCYPASGDAVHEMITLSGQRTVELCQDHDAAKDPCITKDRWASYGWPVVDILPPYHKTEKSKEIQESTYTFKKRTFDNGAKAATEETMSRAEIDEVFPFLKAVSFQSFILIDENGTLYKVIRKD